MGSGEGRTEAALLALFPSAYMVRLGTLRAMHGEVSKTRWTRIVYAVFRPLLPLVRAIAVLKRAPEYHQPKGLTAKKRT